MEDAQLADLEGLDEWEEWPLLQGWLAERLAQVLAVLVEVDQSSVHIEEAAKDGPFSDLVDLDPLFQLGLVDFLVEVEVLSPFAVVVHIASVEVQTPHVLLLGQVLVDQEISLAEAKAHSGVHLAMESIDPDLKVELGLLKLQFDAFSRLLLSEWSLLRELDRISGHKRGLERRHSLEPLSIWVHDYICNSILVVDAEVEALRKHGDCLACVPLL